MHVHFACTHNLRGKNTDGPAMCEHVVMLSRLPQGLHSESSIDSLSTVSALRAMEPVSTHTHTHTHTRTHTHTHTHLLYNGCYSQHCHNVQHFPVCRSRCQTSSENSTSCSLRSAMVVKRPPPTPPPDLPVQSEEKEMNASREEARIEHQLT